MYALLMFISYVFNVQIWIFKFWVIDSPITNWIFKIQTSFLLV